MIRWDRSTLSQKKSGNFGCPLSQKPCLIEAAKSGCCCHADGFVSSLTDSALSVMQFLLIHFSTLPVKTVSNCAIEIGVIYA